MDLDTETLILQAGPVNVTVFRPYDLGALTYPVHDPPVAWLAGVGFDWPLIACPAVAEDQIMVGQVPPGIPILKSEPGRL